MPRTTRSRRDPLQVSIQNALQPGHFTYAGPGFASGLDEVLAQIERLAPTEPSRAVALLETYFAACYEKAEEVDDSDAELGMFVERLVCAWIRARQAAGAPPEQTARWLLDRMDDDPYGFCYQIEREAAKALDKKGRLAWERLVRARFDAAPGKEAANTPAAFERRRSAEILRAIYTAQGNIARYVELCEQSGLVPKDCQIVAEMLQAKDKLPEAFSWVERGLLLTGKEQFAAGADRLAGMKRQLLRKLGRGQEALDDAWAEFEAQPSKYSYEELMRYVPNAKRVDWHRKAMDAAEGGALSSLIELWLETKEIDRLARRLGEASHRQLEGISHYVTEPAAQRLEASHPGVAAKVYRALCLRIINEAKSKYYAAALANLRNAKACYEKAGLGDEWKAVVAQVRREHSRKSGFMPGFESIVAGLRSVRAPSFLDRARKRWLKPE